MGAAQEAWIAGFQGQNPDVNVTYDPAGSGAGREQFIAGGVGFAGSDAILGDDELEGEFAACAPDSRASSMSSIARRRSPSWFAAMSAMK